MKSLLNVLTCFVLCIQLVQEKLLLEAWVNCQINVMCSHIFYFVFRFDSLMSARKQAAVQAAALKGTGINEGKVSFKIFLL